MCLGSLCQIICSSQKKYLDEKGDNVRLFFMPTTQNERIECINPKYIKDENEIEKLSIKKNIIHGKITNISLY